MRLFRLFQLLDQLRARTVPVSAEALAVAMGVSLRTMYRDLADLQAMGAPIRGEGGVGYVMESGYFMPSLHLNEEELEALAFGARLAAARADSGLADAAASAIAKITSGLRPKDRETLLEAPLQAGPSTLAGIGNVDRLRIAIARRRLLLLRYRDLRGRTSERTARPLGLTAFDTVWLLTIWCERAEAFRHLRVDRIEVAEETGVSFRHENGKRFKDCLQSDRPARRRGTDAASPLPD